MSFTSRRPCCPSSSWCHRWCTRVTCSRPAVGFRRTAAATVAGDGGGGGSGGGSATAAGTRSDRSRTSSPTSVHVPPRAGSALPVRLGVVRLAPIRVVGRTCCTRRVSPSPRRPACSFPSRHASRRRRRLAVRRGDGAQNTSPAAATVLATAAATATPTAAAATSTARDGLADSPSAATAKPASPRHLRKGGRCGVAAIEVALGVDPPPGGVVLALPVRLAGGVG